MEQIVIPQNKVSEKFAKNVLPFIIKWINKQDLKNNNKKILFCGRTPLIQHDKYIKFSKPFDIFEPAQSILAEVEDIDNIIEIEEIIKDRYSDFLKSDEKFYCKILKEKVENVKGYFIFTNDKEIIIMTWDYEQ